MYPTSRLQHAKAMAPVMSASGQKSISRMDPCMGLGETLEQPVLFAHYAVQTDRVHVLPD